MKLYSPKNSGATFGKVSSIDIYKNTYSYVRALCLLSFFLVSVPLPNTSFLDRIIVCICACVYVCVCGVARYGPILAFYSYFIPLFFLPCLLWLLSWSRIFSFALLDGQIWVSGLREYPPSRKRRTGPVCLGNLCRFIGPQLPLLLGLPWNPDKELLVCRSRRRKDPIHIYYFYFTCCLIDQTRRIVCSMCDFLHSYHQLDKHKYTHTLSLTSIYIYIYIVFQQHH